MPNTPSNPTGHSRLASLLDEANQLQRQNDGELARRIQHSRELEVSAGAMQKRLRRLKPDLAEAAEKTVADEDGESPRRQYLTATSNAARCEQAYQLARGHRAQLHIMLDVNGRQSSR